MRREAKAWVRTDRLAAIDSEYTAPGLFNTHEIRGYTSDFTSVTVSWDEPDPEPAVGQVWITHYHEKVTLIGLSLEGTWVVEHHDKNRRPRYDGYLPEALKRWELLR